MSLSVVMVMCWCYNCVSYRVHFEHLVNVHKLCRNTTCTANCRCITRVYCSWITQFDIIVCDTTIKSCKMPVAVVTGSNKGIGLGVVRALCHKYQGDVYLTSRDEGRGMEAVAALNKEGLQPKFHVLDIGNEASVIKLRDHLKEKYGGIDVLVNNAGIAFKHNATEPFGVQARVTLDTNYWANKRACEILFPILNPGARVVNMSSSCGFLGHLVGERCGDKVQI